MSFNHGGALHQCACVTEKEWLYRNVKYHNKCICFRSKGLFSLFWKKIWKRCIRAPWIASKMKFHIPVKDLVSEYKARLTISLEFLNTILRHAVTCWTYFTFRERGEKRKFIPK